MELPQDTTSPETALVDAQDKEEEVTKLITSTEAFFILFAVSFGPTFIALNLSVDDHMNPWADVILIVIIGIVFVLNMLSVDMLTNVHSQTKMTSYQEIAYRVSKNNRGYVYLISTLKTSYLIVTCAYSLQFCAVYPVSLI